MAVVLGQSVPLREWMEREAKLLPPAGSQANRAELKNGMLLRKITVAYGISEILKRVWATDVHDIKCSIDNFAVRVGKEITAFSETQCAKPLGARVDGVDMLHPAVSVQISEPSFLLDSSLCDAKQDQTGRYLEIDFLDAQSLLTQPESIQNIDESAILHSLGLLLYELFSHTDTSQVILQGLKAHADGENNGDGNDICQEPAQKKRARGADNKYDIQPHSSQYIPLHNFGLPSSLSLLVQNLLECGLKVDDRPVEAYDSLKTSSSDLHLMLLEPSRFLFESISQLKPGSNGKVPLQFREGKLYGRETEVSQIQEAFCRVSSGQSEAFFVNGYSGSGKTRLVESLRAQVDVAGGYFITQKFDQVSKECRHSTIELVSAFNNLCVQIKEKKNSQDLESTAGLLRETFGYDLNELARLLPNVRVILPQLELSVTYNHSNQMNLQSVGFVLQRFMRVVSSKSHPVMLFLDDLQWCDISVFTILEGILSDKEGSCLFFVGSYRNNEVQNDHAIYYFMDRLDRSSVPYTKLSLFGINYDALNTMISDAMGIFPRLCEPLSGIIFQKTKGNPFFLLEFIKSLVDHGLVQYSFRCRRWVSDIDCISSMDITGNVLFLLTNKMSALPPRVQSVLKVVSCFGIRIHESVVGHLSASLQYSNIKEILEELVWESFMVVVAGGYKFVHDKVREAAYSLIAVDEKDEYHGNLGRLLYSVSRGQKLGEAALPVVDQINRGLRSIQQTECINVAKFNLEAGVKCFVRSDYSTASAYLDTALSLVPQDHWESQYDLSLQLYLLSAKSAHSCGKGEKAYEAVRAILKVGRCVQDKVDAYFLLVNIYQAREEAEKAYVTCLEVLAQLGENVSEYCDGKDVIKMVAKTTKTLQSQSEEELLAIKEDILPHVTSIMKFYSIMATVSFFIKPEVSPFLCCRMVDLTLAHGVTKYSAICFAQYAVILCIGSLGKEIQGACKIGKLAVSLLDRYESSEIFACVSFMYFGFVAHWSTPLQFCGEKLKKGFETGMSSGDTFSACFSANQQIRLSIIGGANLRRLLRETEYYLTIVRQHDNTISMRYFLIYQETIATLIDKGVSNKGGEDQEEMCESLCIKRLSETINFHKALQSFWLGYAERCDHYVHKLLQMAECGGHHRLVITFYHGINTFRLLKRKKTSKFKAIIKDAISSMKDAAQHSKWNYANKVHLLEAELASCEGRTEQAKCSYAAAILSSRSSRFVHEQGLACELAGFHYKNIGDTRRSWEFFNQAKVCYAEWGSEMKVDFVTSQVDEVKMDTGPRIDRSAG